MNGKIKLVILVCIALVFLFIVFMSVLDENDLKSPNLEAINEIAQNIGFKGPLTPTSTKEVSNTEPVVPELTFIAPEDQSAGSQMVRLITEPWKGDLDGMIRDRIIRALVVPSKTMYFLEKGRPRGISYELIHEFEKAVNNTHRSGKKHIKTYITITPVSRESLIPALLEGRGDIAVGAITSTPERQKQVDFSDPFFRNINEIVVTGPASPELLKVNDLSDQVVLVRRSSSYWEHLETLSQNFIETGIAPIKLLAAPEQLEDEDLMEMVNAGLIKIIIVDDYKANLWSKIFPDIRLHPELTIHSGGSVAWMMRKGSPKLKETIDGFAKTHGEGTSVGETLVRRYVNSTRFVKSATSTKEIKKYQSVVELFRKYARQYDLDYLLLMAQGYQESALNQKARSPVGAIGIMQLIPSTGKEMKVGNIHQLEPNIHAGVKYIRFIIDRYFKDESMEELDKTLFAFASYNAGPARIRRLRRTAENSGLNPNVWFDNVELIAAQKIGSETVKYVSNIFKYYVSYKLVEQEMAERQEARTKVESSG